MSKPVKEMIMREYESRFTGLDGALLVDVRGIEANDNNEMRLALAEKNVRVSVIRNALAKKALAGTNLEALSPGIDGPTPLAYGAESVVEVARALVEWARKVEKLDLKGAVLDGEYFEGAEGVKRLSAFPTREEAHAKVVQLILSPAGNIVSATKSAGGNILGIVKEIEERLEKGEAIAQL